MHVVYFCLLFISPVLYLRLFFWSWIINVCLCIVDRGRGRVRVRGLGAVGRERVGDQRWARRPVRARRVGRGAQLRSRGGAGG